MPMMDLNPNKPGGQGHTPLPESMGQFPSESASFSHNPISEHGMFPNTTGSGTNPQRFNPVTDPGVNPLFPSPEQPKATRQLVPTYRETNASDNKMTVQREPVVIKPAGIKGGIPRPPQGRRMVIQIAVASLLLVILAGTLLATIPLGFANGKTGLTTILSSSGLYDTKNDNSTLLAQQAATATAVTQDGFDAGNQAYVGVNPGPALGGSGNRFFQGQCTYWAAYRFHQLHGIWVPWLGNAWEWLGQAQSYGWKVSAQPTVGAIVVLQPGVQGAGGYGHVAIVESINSNGTVHTSNYNWYMGGGGFGVLSYWDFSYPGYPGIAFITN
ncbi:hypothetical protein KSC_100350 [Ktedonobacter sp. SOSP1-52]|uniref:CHAP domain-containing protein n=1 Tax=Ktedonobacter sp. SOSP1-52 TaxID=2778366 RepID=UPI001915EFF0|nr:CHAP domain-containing protein [Ktedonobacter sp. SOSP1-52]GHO71143.1 hypothetical protein KSC_100350 [Ktedonobacter sp. SOSP1-52]